MFVYNMMSLCPCFSFQASPELCYLVESGFVDFSTGLLCVPPCAIVRRLHNGDEPSVLPCIYL